MSRPVVLVASRFLVERCVEWDDGYEIVGPADITSSVQDRVEVIVSAGEALERSLVERLPNLKLVACFSTGYAGIDLGHLRSRGVTLTSAAGVNAHDVADHAIALMLAWWHGIPRAHENVRAGKWKEGLPPRPSLRGKRAGRRGSRARRIEELPAARRRSVSSVRWWGPRDKAEVLCTRGHRACFASRSTATFSIVASRATAANAGQINWRSPGGARAGGPAGQRFTRFLVDESALIQRARSRTIARRRAGRVRPRAARRAGTWRALQQRGAEPAYRRLYAEAGVAMFGQLRENIRRHFAGEPLQTPVADEV